MGADAISFWGILGNLLIEPLKLIFEVIFYAANDFIGHSGLAIIVLSLIMNILVLPLYRRADAMQEEARNIDMKLHDGVAHIKKTFSGDERMMILQTYYRQNNYKPTDALKGSVSLLLEIPFFMAAYQFLSGISIFDGVSLGPIKDLGSPDGLIVIGGVAINALPILMTLINVVSSAIYLKGFPMKTKIQLYGMALFFLVFLYTSPACLVFYWTLNNVFSLVKTIFYKLKNPMRAVRILTTAASMASIVAGAALYSTDSTRRTIMFVIGLCLWLPLAVHLLTKLKKQGGVKKTYTPDRKIFVLAGVTLTLLVGVLIPSAYISASPSEFLDLSYFHNPLWYIAGTASMAAGFFLVWFGVFYWLASPKAKVIFGRLMWMMCGVAIVNYMFFGTNLGIISAELRYEPGVVFGTLTEQLANILVILAVAGILLLVIWKLKKVTAVALVVIMVALGGMSTVNLCIISANMISLNKQVGTLDTPSFDLSKDGKNVVVIMLDRAINQYIPYIFNEKPELAEKFDGFTYYSNVISYGGHTNFAAPAFFGGYEYTPVELNKRDTELLEDKHNESLMVMPVLFKNNGFDVTFCDPTYAGYKWIPDLSLFDGTGVDAYISEGRFGNKEGKQQAIDKNYRNFFRFGVMKSMPLSLQSMIYDEGNYNQVSTGGEDTSEYNVNVPAAFMNAYGVMANMSEMTNVVVGNKNTFMILTNNTTHEAVTLQTPDYTPSSFVDNSAYEAEHAGDYIIDGKRLELSTQSQKNHYHVNMSAMLRLAEWFDYLRERGVYDNTRIIIASDHGNGLGQADELVMKNSVDVAAYHPLLLVKDFDSTGFSTSDEFMTNADIPTLATKGVIESPVNPFTGKPINSDEKNAHEQYITMSWDWELSKNSGYTFNASGWASVKDNMWDRTNWTFMGEDVILKEHSFD